jgi:predicted secreted protein
MNVQRGCVPYHTRQEMWARRLSHCVALLALAGSLAACSGGGSVNLGNSQVADPASVDFPIFYVKRTIPTQTDDVRMLRDAFPQADLYKRDSASPSAKETNITIRVTANATYDVKDVDTSTDGKKVVFAMRGPLTLKMKQKDPPSWRIWEYVIATDALRQVIDPTIDPAPLTVNDVSPHYLPDGRIVFSSTRQTQSKGILLNEGKPQFEYQNEARAEPAFVLHVMNDDGTGVHQLSFNQSHDRDATVLSNGRVLWTRWDNAPGKDGMHLYSANPDGTDVELYYGANSHMTGTNGTVVEFLKPREMQDGRILSLVRQYTKVDFGGDLVIIDGNRFVENTQPTLANSGLAGPAQVRATPNNVITIPGPSPGGRFNSAFALWDGTNRILVSWEQCRLLAGTTTTIVPCTAARIADPTVQTAPPLYSVWMFDRTQNTLLPTMQPVEGVMVTDIVATQPRTLQNIILDKLPGVDLDRDLVTAGVGVLDIKSVYDFDGADTAVPSIQAVADPFQTPASQRPARFIRLEKAVSIPSMDVVNLAGAAFGASNYMREIMGYAPIEPDGSVHLQVPANVAFQISVLDANGRRISPVQATWLQVHPGETLTCNGCHKPATAQSPISHGRSGLFAAAYAGAATTGTAFPNTVRTPINTGPTPLIPFLPNAGETMAEARARVTCVNGSVCSMLPTVNVLYTDVWTDPAQAKAGTAINLRYDDLQPPEAIPTSLSCDSTWASNCRIVIHYPKHIQPIWDLPRPKIVGGVTVDHTCSQAGCHNTQSAAAAPMAPAGQLNLTSDPSNAEPLQFVSYRQLLFQHNQQIVNMGALQDVPGPPDANGNPTTNPVGPYLNAGSANGGLSAQFLGRFATGSSSTHAGWLSPAELRLLSEWLDIGAQYFNNPFDPAVPVN